MAYSKTTWVTGDVVTATKLNHAEDGIATAQSTAEGAAASVAALGANGAIGTANLANGAVTNAKIDQEAVDSDNIRTGAIITPLIFDGAVTLQKLGADVIAELDNKADIDGSYESMTVGNAEQLVSSVGIEDQTPYNFRTSGGSTEIGDREELNAVVGVSVPWNQLAENGNFETANGWVTSASSLSVSDGIGTWTTTNGSANLYRNHPVLQNHIYMLSCRIKTDSALTNVVYLRFSGTNVIGNNAATEWQSLNGLFKRTNAAGTTTLGLYKPSTNAVTVEVSDFQSFDLTQMFGSAIADYIYALEQSNAGAGVAYFRKLFPKSYYAYNSGELLSVRTNLHRMVGFNQFDADNATLYLAYLANTATGVYDWVQTSDSRSFAVRCLPNTTYCVYMRGTSPTLMRVGAITTDSLPSTPTSGGWSVRLEKAFVNVVSGQNKVIYTTGNNATYLIVQLGQSLVPTRLSDLCINLSWDGERNGEYEPYEAHEYALDDITLRGMLRLDANNNLYADGDRYLPDGTVERRYTVVDLGTLNYSESSGAWLAAVPNKANGSRNILCAKYTTSDSVYVVNMNDKEIVGSPSMNYIWIKDTAYTTAAAFKTAMNGVYLVYELATPTTETADPYQQLEIVDDFGTEEFVDERDVAIPVGNETVYRPNLRAKLEMAPDSPSGGDGDYIVRQTNGQNSYIPLVEVKELPDFPSSDGSYKLRCTVSSGTATLSWVSDS